MSGTESTCVDSDTCWATCHGPFVDMVATWASLIPNGFFKCDPRGEHVEALLGTSKNDLASVARDQWQTGSKRKL